MRTCVFSECRKRHPVIYGRVVSHHSFPSEAKILDQWITWIQDTCGHYNFVYRGHSSSLCSRHFEKTCFRQCGRLLHDVYPTITPEDLDKLETVDPVNTSNLSGNHSSNNETRSEEETPSSSTSSGSINIAHSTAPTDIPNGVFLENTGDSQNVVLENDQPRTDSVCSAKNLMMKKFTNNKNVRKKFLVDLSPEDFNTKQKARQSLMILKSAARKTRQRLNLQATKVLRITNKMSDLKTLTQLLKEANKLTEEAKTELDVAIDSILDHMNFKPNV